MSVTHLSTAMEWYGNDSPVGKETDRATVKITGICGGREVFACVPKELHEQPNESECLNRFDGKPLLEYTALSKYTQRLLDNAVTAESSELAGTTYSEIEKMAKENGETLDRAIRKMTDDVSFAYDAEIDFHLLEHSDGKLYPFPSDSAVFLPVAFPLGYMEEKGIALPQDYCKAGYLYRERDADEIAKELGNALSEGSSEMIRHVALTVAEETVERLEYNDYVASDAMASVLDDMSHGCDSGSIGEMIYPEDVLHFFNSYEGEVRSIVSEVYGSEHSKTPDRKSLIMNDDDTKEWMAKVAYETVVFALYNDITDEEVKDRVNSVPLYEREEEIIHNKQQEAVRESDRKKSNSNIISNGKQVTGKTKENDERSDGR